MRAIDGALGTLTVTDVSIRVVCILIKLSISAGWRLVHMSRIDISIVLNVGELLLGVAIVVLVVVMVCHGVLQTRSPPSPKSSHFV